MTPIPVPVEVDLNEGLSKILADLSSSVGAALTINLSPAIKTASYTVPDDQTAPGVVVSDATAGDQTITLPLLANTPRALVFVRHIGANKTTVSRQGSDVIAHPRGTGSGTAIEMADVGDIIGFWSVSGKWHMLFDQRSSALNVDVAGPTQLATCDRVVFCDTSASAADITVKLPTPSKVTGLPFVIIKTHTSFQVIVSTEDASKVIQSGDDTLGTGTKAGTYLANAGRYWKLGEADT